jgi:hypothetical protein
MRRIVVICASLAALALPTAAGAFNRGPTDGQLVVRNGTGSRNVPVVALTITGVAIGRVGQGRVVIDQTPSTGPRPEVTGYDSSGPFKGSQTATLYAGTGFKFRVIGDADTTYTILIYGSNIHLTVLGHGLVTLTGLPDSPTGDGTFSLNGEPFRSLPGSPKALQIASNG